MYTRRKRPVYDQQRVERVFSWCRSQRFGPFVEDGEIGGVTEDAVAFVTGEFLGEAEAAEVIQSLVDGDVAETGLLLKSPRGDDGAAQQFVMHAKGGTGRSTQ